MKKIIKLMNEIPKDYQPTECKTCLYRIAYVRGLGWHFDFHDCIYECDVKCWEEETKGKRNLKYKKEKGT